MARELTNPVPKGWTILGLALLSWGVVIAAGKVILDILAGLAGLQLP